MRVLVTGAARAIGAATCAVLTSRGHDVVATARDESSLASVPAAQKLALDVTDETSIRSAVDLAGDVDAVVNNAGVSARGPLEDFPMERVRSVFDTNAFGPLLVVQAVMGAWRRRGSGVIVNVSSVQGKVATPLEGVYAASKHALEAFSETLHYELSHFGIRVVIVEPGYIAPGMKSLQPHDGPSVYDGLRLEWEGTDSKLNGPGGRPGPELVAGEIANAIENPETPLRVPVGSDARSVLELRDSMNDADFESMMRDVLELRW